MMKKWTVISWTGILMALISYQAQGQHMHFSQFYASPLTLNPALTGQMTGDMRVIANYRNQWSAFIPPYQTYSMGFDANLFQDKLGDDAFGAGLIVLNDAAGNLGYNNLDVRASAAYHKTLGSSNMHYLTGGFQVGFVQTRFDINNATFPNMWDNQLGFKPASGGDAINRANATFMDMQAGIFWYSFVGERGSNLFAGASVFHANAPKRNFTGMDAPLHRMYLGHGGARIALNKQFSIVPNAIFIYQNQASQLNMGMSVEYHVPGFNSGVVSMGGWFRLNDAVIPALAIEYEQWRFGFSYDFTVSDVREYNEGWGAFEFTLMKTFLTSIRNSGQTSTPCPYF